MPIRLQPGWLTVLRRFAASFFRTGRVDAKNWSVGSINGEAGQSCKICLIGENRGLWMDFADEGYRGDALDLVEAVKNLKTVDAMEWSCRWLGWEWPSERAG